eukprot:CAMPEP_0201558862 /NCGR_PEP_ID=MMETSP0173_2-20130828/70485_1 /ASSEMBLY_ACC=CAM_ASM_000268 /TAXON_ID=218659 /ORGANISM="Vexillifera sp., Strain DIVA3 564/2" /LENGTH=1160 /DNA_ID=CAMNT_0047972505 /DNA_START=12 /DNA_END=3490 /DNA_ORIENTATION=-
MKDALDRRRQRHRLRKGLDSRRTVYINSPDDNIRPGVTYPNNYVSTTKYTFWNFLPKNLWEQFHRIANVYFVFIAIITLTPVSPIDPGPGVATIVIVMGISAIKDAYEDWQRFKSDREINNRQSTVLRDSQEIQVAWEDIVVGDIVRVDNNCQFPADLVLLSSQKENGQAHIMTANLDGERNLKVRQSLPLTRDCRSTQSLSALRFSVDCEAPNDKIYDLDATIEHGNDDVIGVGVDQFLIRGTVLKNTQWVYGLVLYTGPQTKYMLNVTDPPFKVSNIERYLNLIIWVMLGVLFSLSFLSACAAAIWEAYIGEDMWYQDAVDENAAWTIGKRFFTFLVLYNNLIPISLYVSLEMVKVMQARFIEADRTMYHFESEFRMQCRTSALNEELGQVEYIFSDKTGTLTSNQMRFRMCSINGNVFGAPPVLQLEKDPDSHNPFTPVHDSDVALLIENAEDPGLISNDSSSMSVDDTGIASSSANPTSSHRRSIAVVDPPFQDNALLRIMEDAKDPNAQDVIEFFVSMAICNTVFPDHHSGTIEYQAESPDELALVMGAKDVGIEMHTKEGKIVTVNVCGEDVKFEVLQILHFDATRKRMSVIVRMPDKTIKVLTKGADNKMFEQLSTASRNSKLYTKCNEDVLQFARFGLRTLVFGERTLTEGEYNEWLEEYWDAVVSSFGAEKKQALSEAVEALETDLTLKGCTAIEDKLQIGVPQTIETLMKADIKLWVLTGDKQETAINIARTCSLVSEDTQMFILDQQSNEACLAAVEQAFADYDDSRECAIVINGRTIDIALEDSIKLRFLELAQLCASVVVCRASPKNKRDVVRLVKRHLNPITLAVGDGANDVSMIQEADIGVGIKGEEGMQAVLNSDYAIGQFRFLAPLLLVHGHWCYKRISFLICYFLYKNFLLSIIPLWFAIDNGFSGQAYFDAWLRRGYNVIFTALPALVVCVLEQDVGSPGLMKYPQLYTDCQRDASFNIWRFLKWALWGFIDSIVCYYFVRLSSVGDGGPFDSSGQTAGLYMAGTITFTCIVVVVNLRLALHTRYWTIIHHIIIWCTILSWFVLGAIYSGTLSITLDSSHMYYVVWRLYGSSVFWMLVLVVTIACLLPDFMLRAIRRYWYPRSFHVIQEATQKKLEEDLRHTEKQRICLEASDWPSKCCRR